MTTQREQQIKCTYIIRFQQQKLSKKAINYVFLMHKKTHFKKATFAIILHIHSARFLFSLNISNEKWMFFNVFFLFKRHPLWAYQITSSFWWGQTINVELNFIFFRNVWENSLNFVSQFDATILMLFIIYKLKNVDSRWMHRIHSRNSCIHFLIIICVFAEYGKNYSLNDINFKSFTYYHATFALNLQMYTNFLAVHANHMPIC